MEEPEEAPRSQAFTDVMEMVQAGITPPNVRVRTKGIMRGRGQGDGANTGSSLAKRM